MSINKSWAWVRGYEGLYMVSDAGDVMSIPKNGKNGIELSQTSDSKGYMRVGLYKDGRESSCQVHRLVAEAFCGNPMLKEQVNHIDGNKRNNSAKNLEWCTSGENNLHKYRVLGVKHTVKSRRRFDDDQIRAIRSSNKSGRELAREFGVSPNAIRQIRNKKSYREVI